MSTSRSHSVIVTGATGFLGRHCVDALLGAGHKVKALCRSDEPALAALGVTVVRGDVLDRASVDRAIDGVDVVVHGAGLVSRSPDDTSTMMRVHVLGTRHVVGAAVAAGVRRVVHLSTSGTVAVGADPEMVFREDDPVPFEHLVKFPYYLSKWLAERAAADLVDGTRTELVTLNPSLALGPGDTRGSSTEEVRRYLKRELPIVPPGGCSFVDVRDVAAVVVAVLDQGRAGERYLLGAQNLTFAQFFERLGQVSGVKGPPLPVVLPKVAATWGIGLLERAADLVGAKLPVTTLEAEMASAFWYCDSRKASRELGFSPREPMTTLLDTVKDIRGEGRREKLVGARRAGAGGATA
ncbi:MAG: NAD-dependent epimerase/dehydratase family protein [Deltaproteobacteria bacterium]|nr:NAD-dependent epimerase/dehydratase family protein [Deltaproteobacteria bacterium]